VCATAARAIVVVDSAVAVHASAVTVTPAASVWPVAPPVVEWLMIAEGHLADVRATVAVIHLVAAAHHPLSCTSTTTDVK